MNTQLVLRQRDTILVVGPSAGGKTESLNILRELVEERGIPHVFKPLSDSHTIIERMMEDDQKNYGRGHYHPTNTMEERRSGHTHEDYAVVPPIPFTLSGNEVGHAFIADFFHALANLPYTRELRFAELSGGRNTNDRYEPASRTDLSFTTYARFLREGKFNAHGLSRVLAVIHPETDESIRQKLNSARIVPSEVQIDRGTASWPLGVEAMRIFGEDDYYALEPLVHEKKIPFVFTIPNDGGRLLREGIEFRLPEILQSWEGSIRGENRKGKGKEKDL